MTDLRTDRSMLAAIVAAVSFTVLSSAAQDNSPPIEAVHLGGPVYMLRSNTPIGNPTTVLSIGEDGVFVADPNLLAVSTALREKIVALGGGARPSRGSRPSTATTATNRRRLAR